MSDGQDLSDPGVWNYTFAQSAQALAEIGRADRPAPPSAVSDHIVTTPQQARARLAQKQADPNWQKAFLAGSAREGREFSELSELAISDDSGDAPPDLIEVVDSISDPHALSRAAYNGLMDGLREQGLNERAENYIRARDAGLTDFVPTQGDGVAFQAAFERLTRDPEVRSKYLRGDIATQNQINDLRRVVAYAAQDGQPVSAEAVEILTRLGLR
jgi:hypothetical protein